MKSIFDLNNEDTIEKNNNINNSTFKKEIMQKDCSLL